MTENKDLIELLKDFNERLINADRGALSCFKEYRIHGLTNKQLMKLKNGSRHKFHVKEQMDEYFSFVKSKNDRFTIKFFHLWLN